VLGSTTCTVDAHVVDDMVDKTSLLLPTRSEAAYNLLRSLRTGLQIGMHRLYSSLLQVRLGIHIPTIDSSFLFLSSPLLPSLICSDMLVMSI
jgi:hypothetical protein